MRRLCICKGLRQIRRMRFPSLLTLIGSAVFLLSPAVVHAQATVQQLLSEAQKAYMRGDLETAKQHFLTVNRLDPRNPTAIGFLRRIQAAAKTNTGGTVEKQLAAVVIPKVTFRDATLGSALEYLKQTLAKTTDGRTTVNFIVQLPADQVNSQTVTLDVTGLPFTEVLRYLGGLANVEFVYDRYAVVVKPKSAAAASTTAAPAVQ